MGCYGSRVHTQGGAATPEKAAASYRGALEARDAAKVRSLVHPATLACINDQNRDVFEKIFAQETKFFAPGTRLTVVKVSSLSDKDAVGVKDLPSDLFYFPTRPSHGFQINAEVKGGSSDTMVRDIASANGSWFVLLPCPTPDGITFIRSRTR